MIDTQTPEQTVSGVFNESNIGAYMDILKKITEHNSSDNQDLDKATVKETTSVSTDDFDSIDFENEVKMEYNDTVSVGVKKSGSFSGDSFKYGIESETGVETNRGLMTTRMGSEATIGVDGFGLKQTKGFTEKVGNTEYEENSEISAGFNENGFTVGQSVESSTKVGNDNAYVKTSNGQSTEFCPNSFGTETHYGVEAKAGPIEGGVKQSNSYANGTEENEDGETVETETATQKTEVSSGVNMGNGVKVKNSVEVEHSEKFSQGEESDVEESTTSISSKTRIEVDQEQAGKGVALMAGIFNATQAVNEAVLKEAFTMTETTEHSKGDDSEENAENATEEEAEDIEKENAKQEAEAETEAEAKAEEEEKSIQEQVEEDTKIDQELQEKSAEMKDEYENSMDYDREEYAEELEDYSYDQEGEGGTGLESVDFSEGEAAGDDYDYYNGYGY